MILIINKLAFPVNEQVLRIACMIDPGDRYRGSKRARLFQRGRAQRCARARSA